jgi:hypothetical protein
MGTKDIELVMIQACESLGIVPLSSIYVPDDYPEGVDERILIHVKSQQRGDIFYKGFVEVNFVCPDENGRANHARLQEVEDILVDAFRYDTVGEYRDDTYRYGLHSVQTFAEKEAKYHYVNARLLFEILNI